MNSVNTKKGTVLPLLNLKGKNYLQVAHRLLWFCEEVERYTVESNFPLLTTDETIATVTVTTYDADGKIAKRVTATKRENSMGFPDHTEKAETGALGRCMGMLGFGTQFALELEEGERIVDSPMPATKAPAPAPSASPVKPIAAAGATVAPAAVKANASAAPATKGFGRKVGAAAPAPTASAPAAGVKW